MEDLTPPETRGRSRSKTPFVLRSSCDKANCTEGDHGHLPVKKPPTVKTISEEAEQTPATVAKTRTTRTSKLIENTAANQTESAEKIQSSSQTITSSSKVTSTVVITSSSKSAATSSQGHSANIDSTSRQLESKNNRVASSKSKEVNQNELNRIFEESANSRVLTSTPISSSTPVSILRQHNVTTPLNGNTSDHAAYKEYRDAGEYWNKYPKTDYTYSELSPHRREIAPGIIAMPNMSRSSLDHHHDRVDGMVQRNPSQESYIRTRYQSQQHQRRHTQQIDNFYDSQDEVDVFVENRRRYSSTIEYRRQSIISWFFTTIVTVISNTWSACTSVFRRSEQDLYYTRIEEEQGAFSRFMSFIAKPFLAVFRYIYVMISSILFLDSWLLRRSNPDGVNKKRFLLLLLILLPLLLLTGAYYYFNKPFPTYPILTIDQIFDPIYLKQFQAHLNDVKVVSTDYLAYVRQFCENSYDLARNTWQQTININI